MGWVAAVISAATLVLLVSVVAGGIFLLSPSNQASASFIRAQPGSIPWNGKDRLTVLCLGLNQSKTATTGLAVLSYDPRANAVRMLSIPPSLWVTIPGFSQDRIASAYADGGTRLALLTVESVTRSVIPYYVALGPSTFRQLVDDYGGLGLARGGGKPDRLNGQAALDYLGGGATGRDGESDRMQRDAVVAGALKNVAVQPTNLLQVVSLVNDLGAQFDTNFPYNQIPPLVQRLKTARLQASALDESSADVAQYRASSGPVFLPDWQRITSTTEQLFPNGASFPGMVQVLNGSGVAGQAGSLAQWLRQLRFGVSGYGSADSFNYARTVVVINAASPKRDQALARSLSAVLQAPVVTRPVHGSKAAVVVIIGRDYQDLTQQ